MSTKARTKKSKERAKVAFVESQPAYEVIKDFKYQDKMYLRGEEWKPLGGIWDRQLIAQQEYVLAVEDTDKIRAEKAKQATARLETMPGYAS